MSTPGEDPPSCSLGPQRLTQMSPQCDTFWSPPPAPLSAFSEKPSISTNPHVFRQVSNYIPWQRFCVTESGWNVWKQSGQTSRCSQGGQDPDSTGFLLSSCLAGCLSLPIWGMPREEPTRVTSHACKQSQSQEDKDSVSRDTVTSKTAVTPGSAPSWVGTRPCC